MQLKHKDWLFLVIENLWLFDESYLLFCKIEFWAFATSFGPNFAFYFLHELCHYSFLVLMLGFSITPSYTFFVLGCLVCSAFSSFMSFGITGVVLGRTCQHTAAKGKNLFRSRRICFSF